jgi:alcohol dehydrogenase, propanol-preferring
VLVHPAWGCGNCALCARGEEQLCTDAEFPGFERDGGFAEWIAVPGKRHLFPIPDLDPVEACVLADAAVTPYRALRRLREALRTRDPDPGATLVIVGAGGLGQFAIQLARILLRMRIVVVERNATKRKIALALGADEALPAGARYPRAGAVLDIVGSDETLAASTRALVPGGVLMLVGAAGGTLSFGLETHDVFELQLLSSINGSLGDLADVLALARRGLLRWDVERTPLDRAPEALERMRRGTVRGRLAIIP